MDFLRKLNEPSLVADFQRFCGVIIHKKPQSPQNGDSVSAHTNNGSASPGSKRKVIDHLENRENSNGSKEDCLRNGFIQNSHTHVSNGAIPHNLSKDGETHTSAPEADERAGPKAKADDSSRSRVTYTTTYQLLHHLFNFGAFIGDEAFYCVLWCVWFWNLDGYITRRVVYIWCFTMYIGQATKDVIRWPRPASPPVARMEKRYELEYGMPSTHAMVGASIPFSILALLLDRYQVSTACAVSGFLICIAWCSVVSFSRLYLGMHSVLDVLAGLLYVGILVPLAYPFLNAMDYFILTHPYSPAVCVVTPLLMCLCYPSLEKWSTARGDTTIILGVGSGICVAMWLNYQHGYVMSALTSPPYEMPVPCFDWFGHLVIRMVIGGPILALTRAVVKKISYRFMCFVLGLDHSDMSKERHQAQSLMLELPYKYITYFSMSICAVYCTPILFMHLGIEREGFKYEL